MSRRSFVTGSAAGLAGVFATGVAPAVVHAQTQLRWRLASSFPKSLDTIFGAAEEFSKQVAAMSGGKFQISVHAGGELMPAFGVVDGVQNGTVEMAHTAPYYFFGKDPTFALGCAIPFGMNSRQMTAWMYEGNGMKLFREFYDQYKAGTLDIHELLALIMQKVSEVLKLALEKYPPPAPKAQPAKADRDMLLKWFTDDMKKQLESADAEKVLRPAIEIAPGERTGRYRVGGDQVLSDGEGRSFITAEDYAVAVLDELETPSHRRQRYTVAY